LLQSGIGRVFHNPGAAVIPVSGKIRHAARKHAGFVEENAGELIETWS